MIKDLILIAVVALAMAGIKPAIACGGDDVVHPEIEPTPLIISTSIL